jgi:thermolysin
MRRVIPATALAVMLLAWHTGSHSPPLLAQPSSTLVAPANALALTQADDDVSRMVRSGELQVRRERDDTLVAGRRLQQLDQYVNGVRIWGASVSRQLAGASAVSVFGALQNVGDLDVTPVVSQDTARQTIESTSGVELGQARQPELVVVPEEGGYRLAWVESVFTTAGRFRIFVDAKTGDVVRQDNITETQLPTDHYVGHGKGVFNDDKKISTLKSSGGFVAFDTIRPPVIATFDMRANTARVNNYLNGLVNLVSSDYASTSSSNDWTDGDVVDAHVYSSYTYDYYFKRFGRRGLDNADISITNLVHLVRRSDIFTATDLTYWANAFYAGDGIMVYGEGCDCTLGGQRVNYFSAGLDVVAHELSHGVTEFSSNLDYVNESGALNEAFSDIMGTSVEFFFQPVGTGRQKADYLIGEDVFTAAAPGTTDGIRSMANPGLFGYPDHYSKRYTGTSDNGGVHFNSNIVNHAFYLAIEGGTNRTSGLSVAGVGSANRLQMERVFYRAFAQLMPSNANFSLARVVTLQAATDLYGATSAAYAAVRDAWAAVGVN